jgi:hypothetical protein
MPGTNQTRSIDRLFARHGEDIRFDGQDTVKGIFQTGPVENETGQWGAVDRTAVTLMLRTADFPPEPITDRVFTRSGDATRYKLTETFVTSKGGYIGTAPATRRNIRTTGAA